MLALEGVLIDMEYVYKHFLGQQFSCVGKTVRQNFSVELPDSFESNYREELIVAFQQELRTTSGIKSVLRDLGVPSCVATSSSRSRTLSALGLVGLTSFFGERIFTASEVKHGKPAPDLFLLASQTMQVEPKRCLVIEDSVTGIGAAVAAGMNIWRYTGARHLRSKINELPGPFSDVPVFDSWQMFYEMAPSLRKLGVTQGKQNDD